MPDEMLDLHKEETSTGIRYTLPPRISTPGTRIMGGVLLLVGLFVIVFACAWMAFPLRQALGEPMPPGPEATTHGIPLVFRIFLCVFAAFGLIPLGMGLTIIFAGLALIIGGSYCQVDLEAHRLIVRDCFGFLHWSFHRKIKDLSSLRLGYQTAMKNDNEYLSNHRFEKGSELFALCHGKKPLEIARSYPDTLVRQLAKELHQELPNIPLIDERSLPSAGFIPAIVTSPQAMPVKPSLPDPGPPPPGVLCDIRPGSVTLDVQAPGIWKGARFFVVFSSLWLFITAAATIPILFAIVLGKPLHSEDGGQVSPWFGLLFISLFWAVGLGMLAAAIHIGTRRTTLFLGDGLLAITITSRLRRWHQQWPLDTLREIKIGPSGTSVNDRPLPCLHLTVGDRSVKILTAWNEEIERRLEWICAVLSAVPLHQKNNIPTDMPTSLRCDPGQDDWAVVPVFVRKGNGAWSMLGVSIFFLVFVAGFLSLVFFVFKIDGSGKLAFGSILGLFAVIGLGIFFWSLWSLNVHRRLAITAGRLSIQEGSRRLDLDHSEILAVVCEPNGTTMGEQKFYRLAIQNRDGTSWTCLSSRPETELRWLAAELNRRLGIATAQTLS